MTNTNDTPDKNCWRDISTAPRDGTDFIGYSPSHGIHGGVSFNNARQDFDLGFSCLKRDWTHWQPLPLPPDAEKPAPVEDGAFPDECATAYLNIELWLKSAVNYCLDAQSDIALEKIRTALHHLPIIKPATRAKPGVEGEVVKKAWEKYQNSIIEGGDNESAAVISQFLDGIGGGVAQKTASDEVKAAWIDVLLCKNGGTRQEVEDAIEKFNIIIQNYFR